VSTKSKVALELAEDGAFKVSRIEIGEDYSDNRSETSSMQANASSASDINSIMIDDVVNWVFRTTLSQKPPVEPFRPSEKSELIGGIGDWTEGLVGPIVLPWRLEAVSLDDIGLCFYDIGPVYTKHLKGLESATPHIPLQNSQWNHRLICRSTAESPESVPTLTEDC